MKRKINISVSILLALIIALVPAAAFCEVDAEDEIGNFGLYEMNFLNSLGIVSFTEGQLTESVTNEEFAGAASVIGGLSSDYFQDGVLDILVDGGYLPSSCAYPDRAIKYIQAQKGMVSVLGYDAASVSVGGYPDGYAVEAQKLKLTDGITDLKQDDELTYGALCVMMYNALSVRRIVQKTYGTDESYKKDATVLEGVFEIYEDYGRVTANSVTSLSGINAFNPGTIEIDGVSFDNENTAYDDCFGYNVKYYYKKVTSNKRTLLYMEIDESANKILMADKADGTYISGKSVYYYDGSKLKSAKISNGYCLVYNKRVTKKGIESYNGTIDGYVKMADTNSDGYYDFVEINSYDTIFVSRLNSYDSEIFDKFNVKKSASFDEKTDDSKYVIRDTAGNDIDFSKIKKNNVVSVLVSEDKAVATAIVSSDVVTAVVDSVSNASGGSASYIYAGDKTYSVADSMKDYVDDISLGEEYKLYFDFSGDVAGYEKSKNVFEYGLLMGVRKGEKSGIADKAAHIKVFKTDSTFAELEFAEKVIVDGESYKKNEDACDALYDMADGGKTYKSKFIRYAVEGGKVVNIDTAYYNKNTESDESLHLIGKIGAKTITRDGQCFVANDGSGIVFDSAVTTFMIYRTDLDEADETEYQIITPTALPNGYSIPNVAGYSTSLKTPNVDYVVIGSSKDFQEKIQADNFVTIMFNSISVRNDDERGTKYCINGWDLKKNTKTENLVNDISKLKGINKGDIVNIRFTYGGEISVLYRAYDAQNDKVLFTDACSIVGAAEPTGNSPKMIHGRVLCSGNTYLYILPESKADTIESATFADTKVVAVKRRQPNYYIYDTSKSKDREFLTSVTRDSVNDYLNTGLEADRVLISSYQSEYSAIIIFR